MNEDSTMVTGPKHTSTTAEADDDNRSRGHQVGEVNGNNNINNDVVKAATAFPALGEGMVATPLPTILVRAGMEADRNGRRADALASYGQALREYKRLLSWERDAGTCAHLVSKLESLTSRIDVLAAEEEVHGSQRRQSASEQRSAEYDNNKKSNYNANNNSNKTKQNGAQWKSNINDDPENKEAVERGPEKQQTVGMLTGSSVRQVQQQARALRYDTGSTVAYPLAFCKLDDIRISTATRSMIKETILLPLKFPQLFSGKAKPWKGLLFYGPAGCGKSLTAFAVAQEAKADLVVFDCADAVCCTANRLRQLFADAHAAAAAAERATLILVDHAEELFAAISQPVARESSDRQGSTQQDSDSRIDSRCREDAAAVLEELFDGVRSLGNDYSRVFVAALTRRPWLLSAAMLRRFNRPFLFAPPDRAARIGLLRLWLRDGVSRDCLERLADLADGFSGRGMWECVNRAMLQPRRRVQSATAFVRCHDGTLSALPDYEAADDRREREAMARSNIELQEDEGMRQLPRRERLLREQQERKREERRRRRRQKWKVEFGSLRDFPCTRINVEEVNENDLIEHFRATRTNVDLGDLSRCLEWKRV